MYKHDEMAALTSISTLTVGSLTIYSTNLPQFKSQRNILSFNNTVIAQCKDE